jgi:6,7-dimethyl-8-ribityllumazine synthase
MSSNDPAFYDHEADAPFVAPPVPRPIVPPAASAAQAPAPVEPAPAEPAEPAAAEPAPAPVEPVAHEPWPGEPAPVAPPVVPEPAPVPEPEPEPVPEPEPDTEPPFEPAATLAPPPAPVVQHVEGDLELPEGYRIVEGKPQGGKAVGIVVARFNGGITTALLQSALDELATHGIGRDAITIMPVPGAFELPIAAMALAKTRRFSCIVALGCVIRGDTPHFDFVAGEAASGLQLAALETGVPVAFGVLTVENEEQARARIGNGAAAVRTGLELADSFARLRAAAATANG